MSKPKTCSFFGCGNTDKSVRYFLFRHHDYLSWMNACENIELDLLSVSTLTTKRYVCEKHFENSDFHRILYQHRCKLKKSAIPKKLIHITDASSQWEESTMSFSSDILEKVLSLGKLSVASTASTTCTALIEDSNLSDRLPEKSHDGTIDTLFSNKLEKSCKAKSKAAHFSIPSKTNSEEIYESIAVKRESEIGFIEAIISSTKTDHNYSHQRDSSSPIRSVDWFKGEIICNEALDKSHYPISNALTDEPLSTIYFKGTSSAKSNPRITPKLSPNSKVPTSSKTLIIINPIPPQSHMHLNDKSSTSNILINCNPFQSTPNSTYIHTSSTPSSSIVISSVASTPFNKLSSIAEVGLSLNTHAPLSGPTSTHQNNLPNTFNVLALSPNMFVPITFVPPNLNPPVTPQKIFMETTIDTRLKLPNARLPKKLKNMVKKDIRASVSCPVCVKRKKQEKQNRNNPKFVKPVVPYNLKRFPIEQFCHKYGELLGPYVTEIVRMQLYKNKLWKMRYSRAQLWMAASIMRGVKKFGYKYLKRLFPLPNESTIRREMKRRKEDPSSKDESIWFDELVDEDEYRDFEYPENTSIRENSNFNEDFDDGTLDEKYFKNEIVIDTETGILSSDDSVKISNLIEIREEKLKNKKYGRIPTKLKGIFQQDNLLENFNPDRLSLKSKREIDDREMRKRAAKKMCSKFQPLFSIYDKNYKKCHTIKNEITPQDIKNIRETGDNIRNPTVKFSSETKPNCSENIKEEENIQEHLPTFCEENYFEEGFNVESVDRDRNIIEIANNETGCASIFNSNLVFEGCIDSITNSIYNNGTDKYCRFEYKEFATLPNCEVASHESNVEFGKEYVDLPFIS